MTGCWTASPEYDKQHKHAQSKHTQSKYKRSEVDEFKTPPLLKTIQQECKQRERWVQKKPNQGLRWTRLAHCFLKQARVDGKWTSWKLALNALDQAFKTPSKTKPWATRIRLFLSLHRTYGVEDDLKALESGAILLSSTRKQIGQLKREYQRLLKGSLSLCSYFKTHSPQSLNDWIRQAECKKDQGFKEGMAHLNLIPTHFLTSALSQAWFYLIKGRWQSEWTSSQDGEIEFKKADHHMPNWFEIEAARAEDAEIEGRSQDALTLYQALAKKTKRGLWYHKGFILAHQLDQASTMEILKSKAYTAYMDLYQWAPEVAFDHGIIFMIRTYPKEAQKWITLIQKRRPFPQDRWLWASALLDYVQHHPLRAQTKINRILKKDVPNTHLALENLEYVASVILVSLEPKKAKRLRQSALLRSPKVIQNWSWLSRK
jgi:hypothetical protein